MNGLSRANRYLSNSLNVQDTGTDYCNKRRLRLVAAGNVSNNYGTVQRQWSDGGNTVIPASFIIV